MNNHGITKTMWKVYTLCHKDHGGLSYKAAAVEMGISVREVELLFMELQYAEPSLFTDISSDRRRFDHNVSRFGAWCDDQVKKKF